MAQHTPGPWTIEDRHGLTIEADERIIGRATYGVTARQKSQAMADARLIAAAPEMLAALEMIVRNHRMGFVVTMANIQTIEAAISKATGTGNG